MAGFKSQLGFKEESTYGTRVVPDRFLEFVSEGIKLTRQRIDSRGIRAGRRTLHRWNAGIQEAAGPFEIELAAQGTGLLLKHLFGAVSTAGTNPYTHTFTPGILNGKSLTVQFNKPDISTDRPFDYTGVKCTSWELGLKVGELAMLTVETYGTHEQTDQSLASVSYPGTYTPFVFTHGSLTIAAAEYEIEAITLTGDNALKTGRHFMRASNPERPKEPLENGQRDYGGTIDSEFRDLTAYNRFVNGTEAALVLTLNAGASAQLTITTNVRFDGETPGVADMGLLDQPLPFKCLHATADASAITAALVNADATP
jgi:hypothetical protein